MRAGSLRLTPRWEAAQRLRLEGTRPSTPGGDVAAESRFYRALAGGVPAVLGSSAALAQRTRVIDAEVARGLGRGVTQIVLLGAAHDGRALRFGGGAARWFEVDRPQLLADKRNRLAALGISTGTTVYVPLDPAAAALGDEFEAALTAAGHDAAAPTLFVAEGTLDTLPLEAAADLCAAVRSRAASGTVLVATVSVAPEGTGAVQALRAATERVRQAVDEHAGNAWRPGDPQKLLIVTGWQVAHAESSAGRRLDPGAHMVILVCAPDPARG
jgi:methyltransferase (TIGR00027 family)